MDAVLYQEGIWKEYLFLIKRYTKEVPKLTECDWNITITADPANIIQDKAFRIDFEIHVFQNRIVWIIQEHFRSFPKILLSRTYASDLQFFVFV